MEIIKTKINNFIKNEKRLSNIIILFLIIMSYLYLLQRLFNILISSINLGPNLVIMVLLFGVLSVITWRFSIAYTISALVIYALYIINEIVYSSRKVSLQFYDVYCISDALRVTHSYSFKITQDIVLNLIYIISSCILFIIIERKIKIKRYLNAVVGLIFIILSVLILANINIENVRYDMNTYSSECGLPYALFCEYAQSDVVKPDGYSKEKVNELYDNYTADSTENYDNNGIMNIIVVMNEAFSDYSLIGNLKINDPLINIHNMAEKNEIFLGKAAVSSYGGQTCNTEWEFITGASLSFLPYGSIPYLQYMNDNVYSFAKDMNLFDYNSIAIHPYFAQEWRRIQNYKYLDFLDFISGENFLNTYSYEGFNLTAQMQSFAFGEDLEYVRGFISDTENYKKVLNTMKDVNKNGNSAFLFNVTIQNHGGYGYDGTDFYSKSYIDDKPVINQYLTLSSISDSSFNKLISELNQYEEKTVLLMFGDHQPGLEQAETLKIYDWNNTSNIYHDKSRSYIVPYILYSNFDIDIELPEYISVNYLSAVLKKYCGIPLTSWDKIRLKAMESYPVLTQNFALDSKGNYFYVEKAINDNLLKDYLYAQYSMLFEN